MQNKKATRRLIHWFYVLTGLFVGLLSAGYGQSVSPASGHSVITGHVQSLSGTPVVDGLVTLLQADSTLLKAAATDSLGNFTLKSQPPGFYLIHVSHVGFRSVNQPISFTDSAAVQPMTIILETQAIKLNEVLVKEKRPAVDLQGDRIVLNIESNPIYAGGSVFDALGMAPRLTVDPITKSIAIDGKTGLILYQNNRQIYLPSDQVISYLQSLPVNSISRIEILTSPPARYDAGSSGVILLYTKGLTNDGVTGEVGLTGGIGRYLKSSGSLSLSLRRANVQGTFLYAPSYRPTYFSWRSAQQLSGNSPKEMGFSQSEEFNKIDNTAQLLRTGWDLKLAPTVTIGTVLQASQLAETENPTSTIAYGLARDTAQLTRISSNTQFKQHTVNLTGNINFRKEFKRPQTSLSADFDFGRYSVNSISTANFTQALPQLQPAQSLQIQYPNLVLIRTAKMDYSEPVGPKNQLEIGAKYSSISMHNQPVTNYLTASFSPLNPLLSKAYQYDERTVSAYGNINSKWANWAVQAGLRVEYTNYRGQSGPSTPIHREYTNLFPSLNLQYSGEKKQSFSLSLNRRIIRPAYDLLNPAYIFYDPLTLYSGNPLLVPQLTTTLQATYSTPKRLSLTMIYSDSRNRITEIIYRVDSTAATTLNYNINFDWERRFATTLSLPIQVNQVWQIQATLTGSMSHYFSSFRETPTLTSQPTALLRLINTLKGKKWSANVNLVYRSTAVIGYLYYNPLWYIDMGIQRTITERSSIKLAASDVFHTQLITNYGNYLNTDIIFRHKFESQRVLFTYSYQFGSTKVKGIKERNFGSETEQERLGGSRR